MVFNPVQDMALVEQAATLVDAFANQVDEFFGGDWLAYRKQVEAAKMSRFRE